MAPIYIYSLCIKGGKFLDTITTVDVTVLKQETKDGASSTLTSKGKLPLRPLSLDVNKKKVKKLIIKPKSTKKETQTKFDSVFTAGLKRESSEDVDDPGLGKFFLRIKI